MKKSIADKIRYKWHRFIHTIYSSYMCIKYPFLYPRNRFTGLHYNNWRIIDYHRNNYKNAVISYNINIDTDNILGSVLYDNTNAVEIFGKSFTANYDVISKRLLIIYNDKIINSIDMRKFFISNMPQDFKILIKAHNTYVTIALYNMPIHESIHNVYRNTADPIVITPKLNNDADVQHFYTSVINKPLYWKIRILDWIHNYPLQWIHIIPAFNEYDAMENGWKIAFGKQMLDELKAELKRTKFLYKYRIFSIKEKYGSLQWDDAGAPINSNVHKIISKYENMSYDYCIYCGKPTKYITRGWITYICDECAHKTRKDGTCEIDYCDPIINNKEDGDNTEN